MREYIVQSSADASKSVGQDGRRGRLGLCPSCGIPHGIKRVLCAVVQAVVLLVGRLITCGINLLGLSK